MPVQIDLLNKYLTTGTLSRVQFHWPPIAIPINSSGLVVEENHAKSRQYVTMVYDVDKIEYRRYEFNQYICDMISAYKSRRDDRKYFEVLLSRSKEGVVKISIGNSDKRTPLPEAGKREEAKRANHILYESYKGNKGYQMSDI